MDLAQLQRAFQRHLLEGDAGLVPAITSSERVPAGTRLGVYADAYRLRLIDALAANYPRLQQLLGAEAFAGLAQDYLRLHPSTNPSVRWFGDPLAEYLGSQHDDQPVLCELARWEWAIANAFDAQDSPALAESDLAGIQPQQWATLRLRLHPSARLLTLATNAPAIFRALSNDEVPPAPSRGDGSQAWLIWRKSLAPHYRSIGNDEADLLQRLASEATFEELCDALCEWCDVEEVPARAAMLLKGWVREELLVRADEDAA